MYYDSWIPLATELVETRGSIAAPNHTRKMMAKPFGAWCSRFKQLETRQWCVDTLKLAWFCFYATVLQEMNAATAMEHACLYFRLEMLATTRPCFGSSARASLTDDWCNMSCKSIDSQKFISMYTNGTHHEPSRQGSASCPHGLFQK